MRRSERAFAAELIAGLRRRGAKPAAPNSELS
jgi:hypothetical protein